MKTFITTDGKYYITRLSRWISINYKYNVSPRNELYYYATDGNGNYTHSPHFKQGSETYLDYFRYKNSNYALSRFYAIGGVLGGKPYQFKDIDGTITTVAAVDMDGDLYDPLYLEFNYTGDKIRVYSVERVRREWGSL